MAHRSIPTLIAAAVVCALLPASLTALRAAPLQELAQTPSAQPESELPTAGKTEYAYGAAPLQKLDSRADGKAQSEALAAALVRGGAQAEVVAFGGTGLRGHMAINRELGSADYPATAVVDAWLRKLLGPR